jgi:BMFP domain-containing protein YqiC
MDAALNPALEKLDKALGHLEKTIDKQIQTVAKQKVAPQLDLSVRDEREVNRKIATRLDQTIERLEILLSED